MAMDRALEVAFGVAVDRLFGYLTGKHKQEEKEKERRKYLEETEKERRKYLVLPTGYGKSLCFSLPPLILDKLVPSKRPHIALVISPLRSLMLNQVQSWRNKGISCAAIGRKEEMGENVVSDIVEANISIPFSSPEAILSDFGRSLLRSKSYKERLCVLAFDEAHCITEWGDDFRPQYKEVHLLRTLASNVPVAMFTAMTEVIMNETLKNLLLDIQAIKVVALLPDRQNLIIHVKRANDFEHELQWYMEELKSKKSNASKAVIYCRSMSHAAEIYEFLVHKTGDSAWLTPSKRDPTQRIIDVYHRSSLPEDQARVTSEFSKTNSVIRCVVATIAFGMGIDVPDVRYIFHWGSSKSPLAYWQEIGRCSRDGKIGTCFLYLNPHSLDPRRVDENMIKLCKNSECFRIGILEHLTVPGMDMTELRSLKQRQPCSLKCSVCKCSLCTCCSRCKEKCSCEK